MSRQIPLRWWPSEQLLREDALYIECIEFIEKAEKEFQKQQNEEDYGFRPAGKK